MFRLNASSTLTGSAAAASAAQRADDVTDDDVIVAVLFLFFLSALLDSAALVTSLKPAAHTHTHTTYTGWRRGAVVSGEFVARTKLTHVGPG